jgi:hypothetical protein
MTKKIAILALSSVAVLVISGCSAKGPQFNGFKEPANGQSNVYLYRTSYLGAGVTPDIHKTNEANGQDEIIGSLKPNGYIMTTITQGMHKFWAKTEAQNEVDLQADPNKIYCIEHYISVGFFVGHPQFEIVDMEKCKKEIIETKLSLQN